MAQSTIGSTGAPPLAVHTLTGNVNSADPATSGQPPAAEAAAAPPPRPQPIPAGKLADRTHSRLSVQTDLSSSSLGPSPVNVAAATPPGQGTTSPQELAPHPNPESIRSVSILSPMGSYGSYGSYFGGAHGSHSFDSTSCLSPASVLPSPALSAMIDITPLPSPIFPSDETPRHKLSQTPRSSSLGIKILPDSVSGSNSLTSQGISSPRKKKAYTGLLPAAVEANAVQTAVAVAAGQNGQVHGRNRSVSDFVPETLHNIRQRVATFGVQDHSTSEQPHMHREEYLATKRGLTGGHDTKSLLSSPPTNGSITDEELDSTPDQPGVEYFRASAGSGHPRRKWRRVRLIGKGTFSNVFLATSELLPPGAVADEKHLDPTKLVAVKICEHGPAGGADESRIKHSLDREIEILRSVSHPSIVHLKAMEEKPERTDLILTYCAGGDLFEFASERRDLLGPELVQRMFAELVAATRYLHDNWIVHRDIKLENVLVNVPYCQLTPANLPSPTSHPFPLITLTDLGLSRRISPPPDSPLLTTRCGSEDYAAPELLLGQPYDGRSTDTWALGVLLYALVEGRLPFDAPPGKVDRSKSTHRIARCDWIWSRMGDEDGEWDDARGRGWEGARTVVEVCLKKVRMGRKTLREIEDLEWVRAGVRVDGGLRRIEDQAGWAQSPL